MTFRSARYSYSTILSIRKEDIVNKIRAIPDTRVVAGRFVMRHRLPSRSKGCLFLISTPPVFLDDNIPPRDPPRGNAEQNNNQQGPPREAVAEPIQEASPVTLSDDSSDKMEQRQVILHPNT